MGAELKPFFVYLLWCADGTYYVGHTDELERRVAQHGLGEVEGYTSTRLPVELVWSQETASREEALAAELRIKGWGRGKKEALIRGDWDEVSRLARSRSERGPSPVRPEPVEGLVPGDAGLRQAQPERRVRGERNVRDASAMSEAVVPSPSPVRPEPVEGLVPGEAGLRQAQPERGVKGEKGERDARGMPDATAPTPSPVRPEPVEGSVPNEAGLRQAQPERGGWEAILTQNRRALAKAITLLESTRPDHRQQADELLNALIPHTGTAIRLGISGVPGVGKSTFIEALGLALIAQGHRVAVLAIDPSSTVSGGSILGDKTRMEHLSTNEHAFIRPSPSSGTLGGVAEKTREAMLVCEAAGYDVVMVETVGVGQSETAVARMTDMFVLLQLPNAGDDLQAIKRGVMELADLVVINKADIDPNAATRAQAQISSSLRIVHPHGDHPAWQPTVMQLSALKAQGIDTFWQHVTQFHQQRRASGEFDARRKQQSLAWMWDLVHARLQEQFNQHPVVRSALPEMLNDVAEARIAPSAAARALLRHYQSRT